MPQVFLKESFRNTEVLQTYLGGQDIDLNALSRLLFQGMRRRNWKLPDHVIRNKIDKEFEPAKSTYCSFVNEMLSSLERRYIEQTHNGQFLVYSSLFAEWQNLITEVPPIYAIAKALQENFGKGDLNNKDSINKYFHIYLKPQVRFSALPSVKDPRLDELINRLKLDDLHIHLNGSSEIELVWRSAIKKPQLFSREIKPAAGEALVKELLEGDEIGLTQAELLKRLRVAEQLRCTLLNEVISDSTSKPFKIELETIRSINSRAEFSAVKLDAYGPNYNKHIEQELLKKLEHIEADVRTPLAIETYLLILMFDYLSKTRNEYFAYALHYYLLIKCQFNRLIVQQTNQFGFDQFQKFTYNEMRSLAEKEYRTRYHQLNYSDMGDLEFLEGRFAPSNDLVGNVERLKTILNDYRSYQLTELTTQNKTKETLNSYNNYNLNDLLTSKNEFTSLNLSLIAHFIKKEDKRAKELTEINKLSWQCRHYELRNDLDKTRRSIEALRERYTDLNDYLFGFDAAANELHAGPDVFAPTFRRLRKSGYHNFTFHAGEDYVHLLSGIRTIAEAIDYLDLKTGNRIGHGTAIGINPDLWRNRIGNAILMKQGDRLDDLVFAYKYLSEEEVSGRILHLISGEIRRLSNEIYGKPYEPFILFDAWSLRYLDPIVAFEVKRASQSYLRPHIKEEISKIEQIKKSNNEAFEIFKMYHGIEDSTIPNKSNKLIEINSHCPCEKSFSYEVFRILQKYVINKLNRRHMAIESLPTSNVRISFYEHYKEHHIFDWLGVTDEEGMEVPVVLGSDDPGIFATNLRNEYAHVLLTLENEIGLSSNDALAKVEQIVRNGKIWRFKKLSY